MLVAAMGVLAACSGPMRPSHPANTATGAYLSPPTLLDGLRAPSGDVRLEGRAPPGAVVHLKAPDGAAAAAIAGGDGRWTITLPPAAGAPSPRLYALQAEARDQILRGEGALAVLPAPAPVAMVLRPGFATAPVGRGEPDRLQLVTVDYDGEAAAASGFAPPQSLVRLTVDGVKIGVSNADAQGRFAILGVAPRKIPPGPHLLRVDTPPPEGLSVERSATLLAPDLPGGQLYTAAPAVGGWTIIWRLTGGGAQSSLVFDDAAQSTIARAAIVKAAMMAPGSKALGPKALGSRTLGFKALGLGSPDPKGPDPKGPDPKGPDPRAPAP
jgi:hypothetical protein